MNIEEKVVIGKLAKTSLSPGSMLTPIGLGLTATGILRTRNFNKK